MGVMVRQGEQGLDGKSGAPLAARVCWDRQPRDEEVGQV